MSEEPVVHYERRGMVASLTLNRPQVLNALSRELVSYLGDLLQHIAGEEDLRALVVTGAGDRAFCAGADLKERRGMSEDDVAQFVPRLRATFDRLARLPVPSIAAINGFAFGGGLELALACDLRIATQEAKMGLTETSLAIIPGAGGTQRLPRLVGPAKAKELILMAKRLTAQEALEIGLVNAVVPGEELTGTAYAWADQLASNGPLAVRLAKQAIDDGLDLPLEQALAVEGDAYRQTIPTHDRLEALAAFREDRKPEFEGR